MSVPKIDSRDWETKCYKRSRHVSDGVTREWAKKKNWSNKGSWSQEIGSGVILMSFEETDMGSIWNRLVKIYIYMYT